MKKVRFIKCLSISDKRFFPETDKIYDVIKIHNDRPVISDGRREVWLREGEFEMIDEEENK